MSLVGDYGAISDDEEAGQGSKRALDDADDSAHDAKRPRRQEEASTPVNQGDDLMLDTDFFGDVGGIEASTNAPPLSVPQSSNKARKTTAAPPSSTPTPGKPKKLVPPQLRTKRPNVVTEDFNAWKVEKSSKSTSDTMKL